MFARSMIRSLALALAVTALPATALAAGPDGKPAPAERAGKGRGERFENQFPMKGADFITMVEGRITKVRSRVQEKLAKHPLTDAQKKAVMAEVDAGAAKVRAEAQKAAADGTVTKEEAKAVRDVAHQAKKDARAKAGLPEHGRGHKKGHGKERGGKGKGGKA